MSGQPAALQVVILRDGLLVGTEVFVPGSFVMGSSPEADLRLDDTSVAPEHAYLYFQAGKAAVQDASSPSGLYVNGHRVSACEIRPVDEVSIGPFVLKVRVLNSRTDARSAIAAPPPARPGRASVEPVGHRGTVAYGSRPSQPPPLAGTQLPPQPPPGAVGGPNFTVPSTRRRPTAASPAVRLADFELEEPTLMANASEVAAMVDSALNLPPSPPTRAEPRRLPQAKPHPQARPQPHHPPPPPAPSSSKARDTSPPHRIAVPTHRRTDVAPRLFAVPRKGKRPQRLYFEAYWHGDRQRVSSFVPSKKPVLARASDEAPLPLYGFRLSGEEDFEIADSTGDAFRLFVPPGVRIEKRSSSSATFAPLSPKDLDLDGSRRFIPMTSGTAVKLTEGPMTLFAYVAPTPAKVFVNPLRGLPWLMLTCLATFGSLAGWFFVNAPALSDGADFTPRELGPVAVRLQFPPKKKEPPPTPPAPEPVKAEEPKPEPVPEKKPEPVVAKKPKPVKQPKQKPEPVPVPPQNEALKKLKDLKKIAAGPGTKDILAAMSKLGSGPGAKNTAFKLSDMVGKAPIAIAGLGNGGLGGVGGGYGTRGAELLKGRGAGGIGALGVGNVGRSAVRGTVEKPVARNVSAQGSIDREAVARVINQHFQEVRACYEKALLSEPGLAGKITLEWTIGLTGAVSSARTKSSSLRNASVEGCILRSLKGWQFPTPKGGPVIITYPFIFNSIGY
ncbi:MAG: AgmX/PglI C-terminal domain-containing protein [Myxococcaceae bacterium]